MHLVGGSVHPVGGPVHRVGGPVQPIGGPVCTHVGYGTNVYIASTLRY